MVSISLSLRELEYLRSLVLSDADTRVKKGEFQRAAITVFQQIVVGSEQKEEER